MNRCVPGLRCIADIVAEPTSVENRILLGRKRGLASRLQSSVFAKRYLQTLEHFGCDPGLKSNPFREPFGIVGRYVGRGAFCVCKMIKVESLARQRRKSLKIFQIDEVLRFLRVL
jgi:hypothetical protein